MFRLIARPFLVAVLAVLALNEPSSAQPGKDKRPEEPKPVTSAAKAVALAARLAKPINLDKPIENDTLEEVIERLVEQYQLKFWIDVNAFEAEGRAIEGQPLKLPKLTGVRLDYVLRRLLRQVNGEYIIRDGIIEV